jgi:hypothetical protein
MIPLKINTNLRPEGIAFRGPLEKPGPSKLRVQSRISMRYPESMFSNPDPPPSTEPAPTGAATRSESLREPQESAPEVDHRGIALPRRSPVAGIITPQ